jgi:hypothetical protein
MSGAVYDGSQELGSLMSKVRITDHSTCQELCMTVVRSRTTDLQIRLRIRIRLFSSLADKMPIENFFCLLLSDGTFSSVFKDKKSKRSPEAKNSRNQGVSYFFCLLRDGSESVQIMIWILIW